tara:strand:+ start:366 stop:593 length:228 start_codon:yes stop_codon:yes gene_type:complete
MKTTKPKGSKMDNESILAKDDPIDENEDNDDNEEKSNTIDKKKLKVFDHFWSLEEQQTILGLLKGRKMKKKENKA